MVLVSRGGGSIVAVGHEVSEKSLNATKQKEGISISCKIEATKFRKIMKALFPDTCERLATCVPVLYARKKNQVAV